MGRAEDDLLKGLDIAAKALADKKRQTCENRIKLVIRGARSEQNLRNKLLSSCAASGLDVDVRPYSANGADIQSDLRNASVVLMPSRAEGFGLVALEAIGHAIPVLVSESSGFAFF